MGSRVPLESLVSCGVWQIRFASAHSVKESDDEELSFSSCYIPSSPPFPYSVSLDRQCVSLASFSGAILDVSIVRSRLKKRSWKIKSKSNKKRSQNKKNKHLVSSALTSRETWINFFWKGVRGTSPCSFVLLLIEPDKDILQHKNKRKERRINALSLFFLRTWADCSTMEEHPGCWKLLLQKMLQLCCRTMLLLRCLRQDCPHHYQRVAPELVQKNYWHLLQQLQMSRRWRLGLCRPPVANDDQSGDDQSGGVPQPPLHPFPLPKSWDRSSFGGFR